MSKTGGTTKARRLARTARRALTAPSALQLVVSRPDDGEPDLQSVIELLAVLNAAVQEEARRDPSVSADLGHAVYDLDWVVRRLVVLVHVPTPTETP